MMTKVFEPDVVMNSFRKMMTTLDETCSTDPEINQRFLETLQLGICAISSR